MKIWRQHWKKISSKSDLNKAKSLIRTEVFEKDKECLKQAIEDPNHFIAIKEMIEKFYKVHPQRMDIITTNYDRVLEHILSRFGYRHTDGFSGQNLSHFDKENFRTDKIINLMKIHGSLNWFLDKRKVPLFITNNPCTKEISPLTILTN